MRWEIKLIVVGLLFLALRAPFIGSAPAWQWDEGVNLNIALNLAEGRLQWFALKYAFVPHPPAYFILGAFLTRFFGAGILSLRLFSVLLSLFSLGFLFLVGRRAGGVRLGLLSALLFAVYPGSVYWNRMAYANHLLTLVNLLVLYLVFEHFYGKRKNILLLGLLAGAAILVEYSGVLTVLAAVLIFFLYERENAMKVFIASLAPPMLFSALMMCLSPTEFKYMLLWEFQRFHFLEFGTILEFFFALFVIRLVRGMIPFFSLLNHHITESLSLVSKGRRIKPLLLLLFSANIALSFSLLSAYTQNQVHVGISYFWLGLAGLFYVRDEKQRNILFSFTLPFFALLFLIDRGDHMLIPLHPFFALGVGVFLLKIHDFSKTLFGFKYWVLLSAILVYHPIVFSLYANAQAITAPGILEREVVSDNNLLVEYLDEHTMSTDLVLGEPKIIQRLNSKTATLLQGMAYDGGNALYYPGDYPKGFYLHDSSYKNAKYVVYGRGIMDYLLQNNETVDSAPLSDVLSWPVAYSVGDDVVRQNPDWGGGL